MHCSSFVIPFGGRSRSSSALCTLCGVSLELLAAVHSWALSSELGVEVEAHDI
jgi:hypothetical protein